MFNNENEQLVDSNLENEKLIEAFKVLTRLIEIINIEIINSRFDKTNEQYTFYQIMEIYRRNETNLYEIMQNINYIYEMYYNKNITKEDLLELRKEYDNLKKYLYEK